MGQTLAGQKLAGQKLAGKKLAATKSGAKSGAPLEPLELFALKVAAKKCDDVRGRLEPGQHAVDVVVRVQGTVSVAESQTSVSREAPSAKTLLGLVFDVLGPKTGQKAIEGVREACRAYVAGGDEPAPGELAKRLGDDLNASCSREVEKTKAGNVTGIVAATVVARGP